MWAYLSWIKGLNIVFEQGHRCILSFILHTAVVNSKTYGKWRPFLPWIKRMWLTVCLFLCVCFPQIFLEVFPKVQSKLSEDSREPPGHEEISGIDHVYLYVKKMILQSAEMFWCLLGRTQRLYSFLQKKKKIFVLFPVKTPKHPKNNVSFFLLKIELDKTSVYSRH